MASTDMSLHFHLCQASNVQDPSPAHQKQLVAFPEKHLWKEMAAQPRSLCTRCNRTMQRMGPASLHTLRKPLTPFIGLDHGILCENEESFVVQSISNVSKPTLHESLICFEDKTTAYQGNDMSAFLFNFACGKHGVRQNIPQETDRHPTKSSHTPNNT